MKPGAIILAAAMALCASQASAVSVNCSGAAATAPTPSNSHAALDYPVLSIALHEEGATIVSFVIGADGKTSAPAVVQSSGSLRLDDASKDAVLTWTYNPAMGGGAPVACVWTAKVQWAIPDAETPPKKAQ